MSEEPEIKASAKEIKMSLNQVLDNKAKQLVKQFNVLLKKNGVEITAQVFNEVKDEANKVLYLNALQIALVNRKEIMNRMVALMRKNDKQAILFFADLLKQTPEFKTYTIKPKGEAKLPRKKGFVDLLNEATGGENNESN